MMIPTERVAELRGIITQVSSDGTFVYLSKQVKADLLAVLDLAEKARPLIEAAENSKNITFIGESSADADKIIRAGLELNRTMKEEK